jgi:hypothetical protein
VKKKEWTTKSSSFVKTSGVFDRSGSASCKKREEDAGHCEACRRVRRRGTGARMMARGERRFQASAARVAETLRGIVVAQYFS